MGASIHNLIFIPLLTAATLACSGKGSSSAAATDSVAPDTIVPVTMTPLPDTAYESARRVTFTIECPDTAADLRVLDLTDMYAATPGAFTFRANAHRDARFGGHCTAGADSLVIDWEFTTAQSPTWGGGSGWTGQPLYVEWPDSCMQHFRSAGVVKSDFSGREIIVGSLDGHVYFIDYCTGRASRTPIDAGNPIKGTVSLDPTLNGNLYVGQGVPDAQPFGAMVIDLYRHERTHMMGRDPKAQRGWGAYDSSPVRVGRFLMRPGENGTLYKYIIHRGTLTLAQALRYRVGGAAPGMEASMSVYRNYGFVTDNHGNVLGVNLDTLRPVWHYSLGDDTDSTPVLVIEDGHPYIYTGCEVDRQGKGSASLAKLDALTGREVWVNRRQAIRADVNEKHFDGGYYGTILPGEGDCSGMIFANLVLNDRGQNGVFTAYDRATGRELYSTPLRYYAWSSPVGMLDPDGHFTVITGDCSGNLYVIRGSDGTILRRRPTGNNFESSPVVIGNTLVVGSRGNKIFKLSLL